MPEPLGFADEPRLLVRQHALVRGAHPALRAALGAGRAGARRWTAARPGPSCAGYLLQLLAAGQKDEQIARALGMSLRTVRRRVADLMTELGSDSRFAAGVEAARRGWI